MTKKRVKDSKGSDNENDRLACITQDKTKSD